MSGSELILQLSSLENGDTTMLPLVFMTIELSIG
jgi:hypothetical protein